MGLRALWWWIDRWRNCNSFRDMTLEQQGAYRNLLDDATVRGGAIPNDQRILANACGDALAWPRVKKAVLAKFRLEPDGWHNDTLDEVLAESRRRSEKQREYRRRPSNAGGNAGGNEGGNNRRPQDQDQDQDLSPKQKPATKPPDPRVKDFLTWFQAEYTKRRHGATYFVRWPKDAPLVKQLLTTYEPERLKRHAQILLTTDEPWVDGTDRGIGILATKINWLEERLATWEATHPRAVQV